MKNYDVYQQRYPIVADRVKHSDGTISTDWKANLVYVGDVQAHSGAHAIHLARQKFLTFQIASRATLAAFPVVNETR